MAIPVIQRELIVPGTEMARHFHKFICPPQLSRNTPFDEIIPSMVTRRLRRELLRGLDLTMWDGRVVKMWVIGDPDAPPGEQITFPSRAVRVNQGDIVHIDTTGHTNTHTIHWHGIEPTPANDGVGKATFELGHYVYQWQANASGTYFYHCHKNTVLHVEMGLLGLLVVDPPGVDSNVFPRPAYPGGPNYDVEAFWVSHNLDSRWHDLNHNAFMASCSGDPNIPNGQPGSIFTNDGFFNDYRPDYFGITGVTAPNNAVINDPKVAINARVGQTILIRTLDAGYMIHRWTLPLTALCTGMDGRQLGAAPYTNYCKPYKILPGRPFELTTARRWDLIIKPTKPGTYLAKLEYLDWLRRQVVHTVYAPIYVSA